MVVGSIDGPDEALRWVFLVKFANEKELVTDGRTDRQTDGPTNTLL